MSDGTRQRSSRTARAASTQWLLVGTLLAAVGFGLYVWGRDPQHALRPQQRPGNQAGTQVTPGTARPTARSDHEPMPTGDIRGWREVFSDSFNGTSLDLAKWRSYVGAVGGDPAGWWDPSHVQVSKGMLVISAYRDTAASATWVSGGINSGPGLVQTYGKYLVRFRFDPGVGIGHALLLTPADGTWPPEIDFSEDNGSARSRTLVTLHHLPGNQKISHHVAVDLTNWHTLGVEWTRGELRYTLDGRVWSTTAGTEVPDVPMTLAIQTQAWPCVGTWGVCPDARTPRIVRLYVDWVVAYAPVDR